MEQAVRCPACGFSAEDVEALAGHLVEQAESSEGRHVMWLNRHVTKNRVSPSELVPLLVVALAGGDPSANRVSR